MTKQNQLKVLIVEDDDSLRAGLQDFLTDQGTLVICCGDGEEALGVIDREGDSLDAVLTDLVMPKGHGLEVLRAAKLRNSMTHVVVMTGFASLETAIDSMRQGAFDYVTKPFKFVEIKIILDKIAEREKLLTENARLSERVQSLYTRLDLLKDNRAKLDRFIGETTEKLDHQAQKIDECLTVVRRLAELVELRRLEGYRAIE